MDKNDLGEIAKLKIVCTIEEVRERIYNRIDEITALEEQIRSGNSAQRRLETVKHEIAILEQAETELAAEAAS